MKKEIIVKPKLSFKLYIYGLFLPFLLLCGSLQILAVPMLFASIYMLSFEGIVSSIGAFIVLSPLTFILFICFKLGFLISRFDKILKINSKGIYSYYNQNPRLFLPWSSISEIHFKLIENELPKSFGIFMVTSMIIKPKINPIQENSLNCQQFLIPHMIQMRELRHFNNCTNLSDYKLYYKIKSLFENEISHNNIKLYRFDIH